MNRNSRWSVRGGMVVASVASVLVASSAFAVRPSPPRPINGRAAMGPHARVRNEYTVIPLVSDGFEPVPAVDRNLVNAWGLASGPGGPWWVSDNGTDRSTLYTGEGAVQSLVVSLPAGAAPTGVAFNGGTSFVVSDGTNSGPAVFLFAGEDGRIFGWNPGVPPPAPSTSAFPAYDSSTSGAIYKGLTLATTGTGNRLYATDFHNRRVDVLDGTFQPVDLPAGAFVDPRVPDGFAPFGIRNIAGRIFVTYAKQDEDGEDDVAGQGLGFVDVFGTDGTFLARIATRGLLNSPWGLALAPPSFGRFGGDLLVGNFGDGKIVAYRVSDDMRKAEPEGVLHETNGHPITIEGLWSISFGNDGPAGPSDTLFFTAGPGDEDHGLFGRIEVR
jgi:uncharacterized protein (TIGR03118 family)